ncbi:MAG: L-aspartate oxidase, partial [candidate division Zixibacteria bacterium]|nr:L-aspartate oxidase [candidate division Zixibacteria bacterium]
ANRLASNSLLEAIATAQFAADAAIKDFKNNSTIMPPSTQFPHDAAAQLSRERVILSYNRRELKRLMWDYVGIVRSTYRLNEAVQQVAVIDNSVDRYYSSHPLSYDSIELRNMVTIGKLIIESATRRKESRGLHYNVDFPDRDDLHWNKDTIIRKQG